MADTSDKKSFIDSFAAIIGIVGSVVTILLTIQNNGTKKEIDLAQKALQERSQKVAEAAQNLEEEIKRRSATVDEAREKVDRYKWVYTLVPNLSDQKNPVNRSTSFAMIRLALDSKDADILLAGLSQSKDSALASGAVESREANSRIEASDLKALVDQTNADAPATRRSSTARLEREFASSASAVGAVLDRLADTKAGPLSPPGLINALYFLSKTQKTAWPPESLSNFDKLRPSLEQAATGPQAKETLTRLEQLIASYRQ